jgi:hypothetical protein
MPPIKLMVTSQEQVMAKMQEEFQNDYPTAVSIINASPDDWGYQESLALWKSYKRGFLRGLQYTPQEEKPAQQEDKPIFKKVEEKK